MYEYVKDQRNIKEYQHLVSLVVGVLLLKNKNSSAYDLLELKLYRALPIYTARSPGKLSDCFMLPWVLFMQIRKRNSINSDSCALKIWNITRKKCAKLS